METTVDESDFSDLLEDPPPPPMAIDVVHESQDPRVPTNISFESMKMTDMSVSDVLKHNKIPSEFCEKFRGQLYIMNWLMLCACGSWYVCGTRNCYVYVFLCEIEYCLCLCL